MGKRWKYLIFFLKIYDQNKTFLVTTNGFELNHDKSLQLYFFYVKHLAKNNFLKEHSTSQNLLLAVDWSTLYFYFTYAVNQGLDHPAHAQDDLGLIDRIWTRLFFFSL